MKQRTGLCAYCGKHGPLTRDHVPPKNLFPSPRPSNLLTIPCCHKCNSDASKDDEYFRLMLIPRIDIFSHSSAQHLWPKVKRSLAKKEKQGFTKSYVGSIKRLSNTNLLTYDVDLQRVSAVVIRTIKGLFYNEFGVRIPKEYGLEVYPLDVLKPGIFIENPDLNNIISSLAKQTMHSIGGEIFNFRVMRVSEPTNEKHLGYSTVWLLSFFGQAHFLGFVGPKQH